jgi:formate hydrogenlyase transcriptional activator
VHIAKDVTARKKAEEALERYAEETKDLYNNSPVGYHSLDKDRIFVRVNDTELSWLGYSRKEIIGKKHFSDLLTPRSAAFFREVFPKFKEQGWLKGAEVSMVRKDGSFLPVLVDATAVKDADGNFVMSRCTLYDISERKKSREALQKAHDELEQRVKERTAELLSANEQLSAEVAAREIAKESLRKAYDEIEQLKDQLLAENLYLQEEIKLDHKHEQVVGNSEQIRNVLYMVEQVATTDSTVLIQGETGTGKELIAHAIHKLSARRGRLLVKVNCAALPSTLIESELFGREKGAFTGALTRQMGRFELADKSTIFLDEIDSLSPEVQGKLLRVLNDGEFERLGTPKTIKVDVRIIAATNRDLIDVVRDGRFREDLYYRLNIFPITVPPLRDRKQDILPMVWSFVKEFGDRMGKRIESIPQKCIEGLQAYHWPGNVRELRNIVERSMIITVGPALWIETPKMAETKNGKLSTLEEVERRHIIQVLNSTGWKVSGGKGAAEILGMNPKTLESRLKKLGMKRKKRIPDI